MTLTESLLLIIVIAGALYAGYLLGRWSVLSERGHASVAPDEHADADPLPGPRDLAEAPRRSAAPPPASAGGGPVQGSATGGAAMPPRRSSTPPPARAGLMDTGGSTAPPKKRN